MMEVCRGRGLPHRRVHPESRPLIMYNLLLVLASYDGPATRSIGESTGCWPLEVADESSRTMHLPSHTWQTWGMKHAACLNTTTGLVVQTFVAIFGGALAEMYPSEVASQIITENETNHGQSSPSLLRQFLSARVLYFLVDPATSSPLASLPSCNT